MKNWKDKCNYRRIKDKDGVVIANVIYIDGEAIEVTDEVYEAYAQMGRRERYLEEQMNEIPHVSLEKLMEADVPLDVYTDQHVSSAEKIILEAEDEADRAALLDRLPKAMAQLTDEERETVQQIYFAGMSLRKYAKEKGVPTMTMHYRLQKTLKKIKENLN